MKFISKILAVATLLVASAFGYTGQRFTANFTGPVEVETSSNPTNNNIIYSAVSGNVIELVEVRTVTHDIPVDFTSSEFYRDGSSSELDTRANSNGYYQGHPYSYGFYNLVINGVNFVQSKRIIIVDSRTVIFISLTEPRSESGLGNGSTVINGWEAFEDSLVIR